MSPDHRAENPSSVVLDHQAAAEAAIMLIESVILILLETGIISRDRLLETVETVIEAKRELVENGIHPEISARAAGMLSVIANSVAAASTKRNRYGPNPSGSAAGVGAVGDTAGRGKRRNSA